MSQLALEKALFDLPREIRIELAYRLISSLSELSQDESDALVARVVLKRFEELQSGKVQGISGEEALRPLKRRAELERTP
jgi:hypothetical protein